MVTWNGFHALDLRGSWSSPTGIHSGSFTPPTWHAPPCFLAGTRWLSELLWPMDPACCGIRTAGAVMRWGAMATHTCARPMRTHDLGGSC